METFDEYGQRMVSENKISSMQKYMPDDEEQSFGIFKGNRI